VAPTSNDRGRSRAARTASPAGPLCTRARDGRDGQGKHAAVRGVGSTTPSASDGDDLDRGTAVACLPGLQASGKNGAIVAVADAVQQVHLDLARPMFYAKARRSSKKLEQIISQIRRIDTQTHSRSSFPLGSRRSQPDRLHEGRLFHPTRVARRRLGLPCVGGSPVSSPIARRRLSRSGEEASSCPSLRSPRRAKPRHRRSGR
jgi:hypothetical protein